MSFPGASVGLHLFLHLVWRESSLQLGFLPSEETLSLYWLLQQGISCLANLVSFRHFLEFLCCFPSSFPTGWNVSILRKLLHNSHVHTPLNIPPAILAALGEDKSKDCPSPPLQPLGNVLHLMLSCSLVRPSPPLSQGFLFPSGHVTYRGTRETPCSPRNFLCGTMCHGCPANVQGCAALGRDHDTRVLAVSAYFLEAQTPSRPGQNTVNFRSTLF